MLLSVSYSKYASHWDSLVNYPGRTFMAASDGYLEHDGLLQIALARLDCDLVVKVGLSN